MQLNLLTEFLQGTADQIPYFFQDCAGPLPQIFPGPNFEKMWLELPLLLHRLTVTFSIRPQPKTFLKQCIQLKQHKSGISLNCRYLSNKTGFFLYFHSRAQGIKTKHHFLKDLCLVSDNQDVQLDLPQSEKDVNTHTHIHVGKWGGGGGSIKSCSLLQQFKFVTDFLFQGKYSLLEFCTSPESISEVPRL